MKLPALMLYQCSFKRKVVCVLPVKTKSYVFLDRGYALTEMWCEVKQLTFSRKIKDFFLLQCIQLNLTNPDLCNRLKSSKTSGDYWYWVELCSPDEEFEYAWEIIRKGRGRMPIKIAKKQAQCEITKIQHLTLVLCLDPFSLLQIQYFL